VQAADGPDNKPVRLVVSAAPAGPIDIVARAVGVFLGRTNGRKYVVENRAGASGLLAATFVSQAEPDASTLLVTGAGSFLLAREPDSPKVDLMTDLAPIAIVAGAPTLFVTDARQGAPSLARLVEDSVRSRKPVSWGSAGVSTFGYFLGQSVFTRAGAGETIHVPYKGGSQALLDVAGGNVQVGVVVLSGALPLLQSGQLKALAISSPARNPQVPYAPTFAELGYGDLTFLTWFAILAPKNTPAAAMNDLRRDLALIKKDPEFIEAMSVASLQVSPVEPSNTNKFIRAEMEHWSRLQQPASDKRPGDAKSRP
jgi:tripartite-type tricarboxylate transporter receptor subunit TctC